jgi:thioesterase domain-containing protein/aryl carrier-like protein
MWYLFIAEDSPNSRWVMIELIHHLIDDRTTMRFLRDEIRAVMQGHGDSLPPPVPFRNSIAQARLGISHAEHEAFFRRMLGDVRQPTAPFGLLDVQGDGSKIAEAYRELDAHLNRRLHACARLLGVSTASLCHLAWGLVLSQTCGRDDVVFGTVMFGRTFAGEDAARALGMFINTLPLCIRLGKDDVTLSARATHDWLVQLLKHEHAPLALAQRCSGVRAPTPLFTSLLNYRHFTPDSHDSDESLSGMKLLAGYERANYPVNLSINDSGEGLSLDAQVDASIDADYVCELMHTALASLVDALEHSPSMPVSALQVLPAGYNHSGFQVATHERTSLPERDRFVPTPYEAPRDLIENAVARIWADILKHERVGRLDHFFELGGHSLLAMQTVQRLKRAGLDVAVPDLFSYPTVEALASAVRARSFEAQASVRPPLAGVALSRARVRQVRQGAQTPLFLLHDGYGDELYFSVLAHHLPGGFPVMGLPPTGPSEPLLDTVEAMAARMLDLISGVQYNGPYRLLGWSFGGLLAYEMAHQLSERGEVVEFLGLIDAFCPDAGPVHPLPARTPEAVLRALGQSVFAGRPGVGVDSSSDEADVGFDELLVRYRGKGILPTSFEYLSTAEVREQCRQLDMNGRAMQIYRPRSISVAVDLFVADEQSEALPAAERRALGWQRCVAPHLLRVYRVPGTHESMMKVPHVRVLGDTVGKALTAPVEQHHNTAREAAISEIRRAGLGVPNA